MSDNLIRSALGPAGVQSPRSYTRAEIASGRRLGLINGTEKYGTLGGPMFWATGDYHPDRLRKMTRDLDVVLLAIQREWERK